MSDRPTAVTGVNVARSLMFGLLTIAITAPAHAAAGGAVPALPGLAVLVLATAVTAWPVLRRAAHPAVLFGVVGIAQIGLHPAFQALAVPAGHAGHPGTPWMVVAHLAAGLGAVALVMAVDPVVRLAVGRASRRRVPTSAIRRPTGPVAPPALSPVPLRVTTDAPRRGPPAGGAVPPHRSPHPAGADAPPLCRSGVLL